MIGEKNTTGSIDTTRAGGEITKIYDVANYAGRLAIGLIQAIAEGGRELLHEDTRQIHLPVIVHRQ